MCSKIYKYTAYDTKLKLPYLDRKTRYLEQLRHASPSVRLLSLADKLHNASFVLAEWQQRGDIIWNNFNARKQKTLWFYQSIAEC
ncbi:MAG: hypothetical protein PUP93_14345 [Rhizonema sp. NSF051]|nr:hypothetical protein [Rhizonema sp. NSF051]